MAGKEMDFPAKLFHRHYVTQRAGKYDETSRSDQQNAKPTQNRDILRREFFAASSCRFTTLRQTE